MGADELELQSMQRWAYYGIEDEYAQELLRKEGNIREIEFEILDEIQLTGRSIKPAHIVEVWPSPIPGYSWVALFRDSNVDTLKRPVAHQSLIDVLKAMGAEVETMQFSGCQYLGDRSNRYLHEPSKTKVWRQIYFIQSEFGGPIKIGSSQDAESRLVEIQRMSPVPLIILATVEGGTALETELQKRFRYAHSHDEWFDPVPELLNLIREYQK